MSFENLSNRTPAELAALSKLADQIGLPQEVDLNTFAGKLDEITKLVQADGISAVMAVRTLLIPKNQE